MQTVNFETSGCGLWSRQQKAVRIVDMRLGYVDDEGDFGELCVYFDTADWNVETDGLIYTDRLFMTYLRNFLNEHGLPGADVDYSEQGMQGDDYVSFDIGRKFLQAWDSKFNTQAA